MLMKCGFCKLSYPARERLSVHSQYEKAAHRGFHKQQMSDMFLIDMLLKK